MDEIRGGARPAAAATAPAATAPASGFPLLATGATMTLEGDQALLRFTVKIPGEPDPRPVAEILVAKTVFSGLLASFFPSS